MKSTHEIIEEYLQRPISESEVTDLTFSMIHQMMKQYAQQFIDAANQIIGPATELLPDTYDKDYENWFNTVELNK